MMLPSARLQAAFECCENLLSPGKKWRLSPYVQAALDATGSFSAATTVPAYQSAILDLLKSPFLPSRLSILDIGSPSALGLVAVLDALLAWQTACALYDVPSAFEGVTAKAQPPVDIQKNGDAFDAFRRAVLARAGQKSDLPALSLTAGWLDSTLESALPNLILVAFPWDYPTELQELLDQLPPEGIIVALSWPRPGSDPSLFAWRHDLLKHRTDFVASGACGQEYGRDLPQGCATCSCGRREAMHSANEGQIAGEAVWQYAMMTKRAAAIEKPPHALVSDNDLAAVITDGVYLRYVGTWRQKQISSDHPDAFNDNPADEGWREFLRVCPGHATAATIAIERRAGMQSPRMRYGQWLHLSSLQPQRPYQTRPDICILRVRDEARFQAIVDPPLTETLIGSYSSAVRAAVDETAYRLFGFQKLREFQHTILQRVLCGWDVFAIAATGSGKSECYILPALLLPGVTVVVSPLKSLILDQYEQRIRDRYGLDYLTTFINSDVGFYERQGRLRRTVLGHFKLIYLTPEQLERDYVLDALRQTDRMVGVRYLAMDEAHCISQWGHDFRPSYLNIVQRLKEYELKPCRIALTATASPQVREDVCHELGLDARDLNLGGDVFLDSSNRPELNFVVWKTKTTEEKAHRILEALHNLNQPGSAIVFMPHTGGTPDNPQDLGAPRSQPSPANVGMVSPGVTPFARYLERQLGQPVAQYHGALDNEAATPSTAADVDGDDDAAVATAITRQAEQRSFMSGQKRVMVATKGFGMGVDKPDIRLVIHRSPPGNLEAYAQEAGRAGRDGNLATVMLLVSNDRPQITSVPPNAYLARNTLPSDREIQQYFIEQRYVRRQDVEAMLAFLRSDRPQRINGALYFTNDQAMHTFDESVLDPRTLGLARPYQWPDFGARVPTSAESEEHRQIRDTGYLYNHKRAHIARILTVLFNNRPSVCGQIIPALRTVHETGTLLRRFRLYKAERIVASPAYFGQRFRQASIFAAELRSLMPDGDRTDLVPLAMRLSLSLRETASMLRDIRYCEGHTDRRSGHWTGTLCNFWWIEAPRRVALPTPYDVEAWRRYAGAWTRARPSSGSGTLDDYFPERVLNHSAGWEVVPDEGLSYAEPRTYLDAFMAVHDERRQNDESNFAYLLERYAGLNAGSHECLRSLLLGYLKTNEVVLGGRCFGCSVCVPDLNFERYPVEERKRAIARLLTETIEVMNQVEGASRQTPSPDLMRMLLDAVCKENEQGRSGSAYLDSWLARLIQDDPEHQAALWVRLEALDRGMIRLAGRDLVSAVERLVAVTTDREALGRLHQLIERHRTERKYCDFRLPLTIEAGKLACREQQWTEEAKLWQEAVNLAAEVPDQASRQMAQREALLQLMILYQPSGRLADTPRFSEVGLQLARLPGGSLDQDRVAYRGAVSLWNWPQVLHEVESTETIDPPAALLAWLDVSSVSQSSDSLDWLQNNWSIWHDWSLQALQQLGERLGSEVERLPSVLQLLAKASAAQPQGESTAAQYLMRAWSAGADLDETQLKLISAHFSEMDPEWCKTCLGANLRAADLVARLWQLRDSGTFPVAWLPRIPQSVIRSLPSTAFTALLNSLASERTRPSLEWLSAMASRLNQNPAPSDIAAVVRLADHHPRLATQLLSVSLASGKLQPLFADAIFPRFLAEATATEPTSRLLEDLRRHLGKHREWYEQGGLVAECVDNWHALGQEGSLWPLLRQQRIEGQTLVQLTRRWIEDASRLHRIDLLVVILRDIQKRSSPNWLTPLSLEFQALCAAGRFAEAEGILDANADLRISGQSAQHYLKSARARISGRRCEHEAEFRRLWALVNG